MADVFILVGEEMDREWLHITQRYKKGMRTRESEDDGSVCLSTGDQAELLLNQFELLCILCAEIRDPRQLSCNFTKEIKIHSKFLDDF